MSRISQVNYSENILFSRHGQTALNLDASVIKAKLYIRWTTESLSGKTEYETEFLAFPRRYRMVSKGLLDACCDTRFDGLLTQNVQMVRVHAHFPSVD